MNTAIKWLLIATPFLTIGYLATLSDEPVDESGKFVDIGMQLSKNEMIADLDSITATFEKIHPNPYRFKTKAQFISNLDSIKVNLPDSLETIQFWRLIDKVIGGYTDAHSYAEDTYILTDYVKKGGLFFPFSAKIQDGEIIVSKNMYGEQILPEGAKIQTINDRYTQELIRELTNHSGKETYHLDLLEVSDDFGFYLWKAFGWDSAFNIQYYQNRDTGILESAVLDGITWKDRKSILEEENPNLSFAFLEEDIGYMKISDFNGGESEIRDFYKDSFNQLSQRNSDKLILDFRGHSGGRDSYGEDLARYIANQPFRKLSKAYWKITPEFKEAFDRNFIPRGIRWFKPIYLINEYSKVFYGAEPNQTVTVNYKLQDPLPEEKRFLGEVYLITDHQTFSAGSIFAEMFKHYQMGKVVGQPTGNLYSFNGFALANFTLPNSKLTYQVSSVYNVANNGEEGLLSVEPDYLIEPAENPIQYILQNFLN